MYRMIGADGREYGPISAEQLRQWIGQGRANAATNVLREGSTEWKPLGSLPEFSMMFAAATPAPTPTPTAPAAFPSPAAPLPPITHGFATAGCVCGILSITIGLCCCYSFPFSAPGLVLSIIALSKINSQPERYSGKTMAIIGIVLCCVSLLIAAVMVCLGMAGKVWEFNSPHHGYRL
jgi:hypothetical protein